MNAGGFGVVGWQSCRSLSAKLSMVLWCEFRRQDSYGSRNSDSQLRRVQKGESHKLAWRSICISFWQRICLCSAPVLEL